MAHIYCIAADRKRMSELCIRERVQKIKSFHLQKSRFDISASGVQKMKWVKAFLIVTSLVLGCADLLTTNEILHLGLGELNPFMRLAQEWFGVWWLIPKLSLTLAVAWLLSRSNNVFNISLVVAFLSTPVLNNLIVIAGTN